MHKLIEIAPSFTENIPGSPQELLKHASSNNFIEVNPSKLLAKSLNNPTSFRKQAWTFNAWDHHFSSPRSRKSNSNNQKNLNLGTAKESTRSKLQESNNSKYSSLESRPDTIFLNFKYSKLGRRPLTKRSKNGKDNVSSQQFYENMNKQKNNLMNFYRNEKTKRTLMSEFLQVQQSLKTVAYPILQHSPQVKNRKLSIYKRYFN